MGLDKPFKWLREIEQAITDYNEGQKENSVNNNIVTIGNTRTGKDYLESWLKEIALRTENAKLIELHVGSPSHLNEVLQFMFPNGYFKNRKAVNQLKTVRRELKKDSYSEPTTTVDEINDLLETLRTADPATKAKELEKQEEQESNYRLQQKLREARELQEEIQAKLSQTMEYVVRNDDMPKTFRKAYSDGANYNFNIKVFTPISADMPTEPVPDFFQPFAVPVDDYKRYSGLDAGLKIVHGKSNYRSYKRFYRKVVDVGDTTFADLKNVETGTQRDYVQKVNYGEEGSVEVTRVQSESQSKERFERDWEGTFAGEGIVCSSTFKHKLRPQLKEALLDDETDIITLYTGFLRDDELKRFVMTYFLETYKSIIENLSGDEVKELDRKFIVSMREAQEAVKVSQEDSRLNDSEKVFNTLLRQYMNNSAHFNTDFWNNVKADEAHSMLLSKSRLRIVTRMEKEDFMDHFQGWDKSVKDKLSKAFENHDYRHRDKTFPEFGYGFVVLSSGSVPQWKRRGRTTYGHRLPCPRMCVERPVDEVGRSDFRFFTEELGYKAAGQTIRFQDYQEELFEDDWKEAEKPYIDHYDKKREKKKREEEQTEEKVTEARKQVAVNSLEAKVQKHGIPGDWKSYHVEIKEELEEAGLVPSDFSERTIMDWTQELRDDLEENFQKESPDELEYRSVAEVMVQDEEFVFGARSKDAKIQRAKEYILDEYPDCGERAAQDTAEDAADKAVSMLQTKGLIDHSFHVDPERERFEQVLREKFDFIDDSEGEDGDENSSLEEHTSDDADETRSDSEEEEDEVEGPTPDEEWMCLCGRMNSEDATVCQNPSCMRPYEDTVGEEDLV